jgi:hypothetical protein
VTDRARTVDILTHPTDGFDDRRYLVKLLIPRWEAQGLRVRVLATADRTDAADLALLHVDLTVVPDEYRRALERYPRVLNGRVLDIRKRTFSAQVVERDGGPDPGPVIVKTDLNCGGWREFCRPVQASRLGALLRRLGREEAVCLQLQRLEARRSWKRVRLVYGGYRLYRCRGDVPPGVWQNPNLVVERFVAERAGPDYCCRHWLFFGDREVHRRTRSGDPMVKLSGPPEPLADPIPEELRTIRARLGFDYGKFDYGLVDGRVVLYDVNRTPGAGEPASHRQTVDVLAGGLSGFLDAAGSYRPLSA